MTVASRRLYLRMDAWKNDLQSAQPFNSDPKYDRSIRIHLRVAIQALMSGSKTPTLPVVSREEFRWISEAVSCVIFYRRDLANKDNDIESWYTPILIMGGGGTLLMRLEAIENPEVESDDKSDDG